MFWTHLFLFWAAHRHTLPPVQLVHPGGPVWLIHHHLMPPVGLVNPGGPVVLPPR